MRTGQLNQCEPVRRFLAPARAQTAPLGQPTECPFHDPPSCRKAHLARNGWPRYRRFATTTAMFDMWCVPSTEDKFMHICIVVASVSTKMLRLCWPADHDRQHDAYHGTFVVAVRPRNLHGEWRTPLIDQDMNLTATLGPIRWVLARGFATQRGCTRATIDGLPVPRDALRPRIEPHQDLHDFGKAALLLPGLKAFMQDATGHTEPRAMDRFPLAARPQDMPDAVEHRSRIGGWSSWSALRGRFGQERLDFAPQGTRHAKIVNGSRFCGSMCRHGGAFLTMSDRTSIVSRLRRFVHFH